MTTHLNQFNAAQREALELLRKTIRTYATADFGTIVAANPMALARGLADAHLIVASDPYLLAEAGRQMYTQFNLAPYDQRQRNAVLAGYHDEAQLAAWTVVAMKWIADLAMAMADRSAPTQH
ncbi:hypothetical protein [Paraburkholderia metrosideri]|uniref:Uncharacterized protein n=1 Tax=Paraburkholderia metrosideri TaxID=580937 RepID=A0ABM8P1M4_9BURK|nr:hypothetical protein [Paraburkholderia metrosideri]CAD6553497.1 hypothetical protein LMG28140_05306 [Paraburkholderia metrosideri]